VSSPTASSRLREALVALALLLGASVLYWKLRILDTGVDPTMGLASVDMYIAHVPMSEYGFATLRSGRVPLWNPYQFCGEPFLAIPYTGLFYPLHQVALVLPVVVSLELLFVLHMLLGGFGAWALARHFGIGTLGAFATAVTFMWSGWMILNNLSQSLFEAMTWMPVIVLLLDRVLTGAPLAGVALALGLAAQLLLGAAEITVHTLYVGGVFVLCRLLAMIWAGEWRAAVRRSGVVLGGIGGALLLAAPQLFPSAELTRQSTRQPLTLTQTLYPFGYIPPTTFLRFGLETGAAVTVGVIPIFALALVLGSRRYPVLWVGAVVAAVLAAILVFGGTLYRLYFALPLANLFRRPMKFLDIYGFAQALLVGAAIERLESWTGADRGRLWRHPAWLGALALAVAALAWLGTLRETNWWLVAALALLVAFGVTRRPAARRALVGGLVLLQAANLFLNTSNQSVRPIRRPEVYRANQDLLDTLKASAGYARIYISPTLWAFPDVTPKQGLLNRMYVLSDYESLVVGRYAEFFDYLTLRRDYAPFDGAFHLTPTSRLRPLELTGTRYFLVGRGEPADTLLSASPDEYVLRHESEALRVFEKRRVLPRAWVVPRLRAVGSRRAVMGGLNAPDFDPRAEALVEAPEADAGVPGATDGAEAQITTYEPERVIVRVQTPGPGFLVLSDLAYPGWHAEVGGRERPIHLVDFLFRAVPVDAGESEVRFEYRPASWRAALWVTGVTATAIALRIAWSLARRGRRPSSSSASAAAQSRREAS
jgi:hypothetical protein